MIKGLIRNPHTVHECLHLSDWGNVVRLALVGPGLSFAFVDKCEGQARSTSNYQWSDKVIIIRHMQKFTPN